ncbi:unnamed protein product [Ectocarpus sp. 12 AP-2014]
MYLPTASSEIGSDDIFASSLCTMAGPEADNNSLNCAIFDTLLL